MSNSLQASSTTQGSFMPDDKIKPPNYDLSPRKTKSIVPKSQLSPSPVPKSIFDTTKMPVQNGINVDESQIINDLAKKNIDKEAEALIIVSEIEKMKQNESQKINNQAQHKLGPAETGSLKEHKEAQLSKFNSRISNQPVFPPNYLEFDSSDSSLGCDEDLALRKREFHDFPEPMKKLESPKISVLEMTKQFNDNYDSLPSSKNAFRHFDFEDDGEGDFENFEMPLKSSHPSTASSGPLPSSLSHTLPKSGFDVPVSKKYDQFGRRKSDEIKKDALKKSGSATKIGESADGLDKVGQRALASSMKRTTSFEALKVCQLHINNSRTCYSFKMFFLLISPLCLL